MFPFERSPDRAGLTQNRSSRIFLVVSKGLERVVKAASAPSVTTLRGKLEWPQPNFHITKSWQHRLIGLRDKPAMNLLSGGPQRLREAPVACTCRPREVSSSVYLPGWFSPVSTPAPCVPSCHALHKLPACRAMVALSVCATVPLCNVSFAFLRVSWKIVHSAQLSRTQTHCI